MLWKISWTDCYKREWWKRLKGVIESVSEEVIFKLKHKAWIGEGQTKYRGRWVGKCSRQRELHMLRLGGRLEEGIAHECDLFSSDNWDHSNLMNTVFILKSKVSKFIIYITIYYKSFPSHLFWISVIINQYLWVPSSGLIPSKIYLSFLITVIVR